MSARLAMWIIHVEYPASAIRILPVDGVQSRGY